MTAGGVRWSLLTPAGVASPVAVIELTGEGLEEEIDRLGLGCSVGGVRHVSILGVDEGVVARPSLGRVLVMPHGGPAVVRRVVEKLTATGIERREAVMEPWHEALSTSASPLVVDAVLERLADGGVSSVGELGALVQPPTVVLVGPPNVGKSTLLNALAGRSAVTVADEAGTTLDHVGVRIDFAGLVCDVVDTPGVREVTDALEAEAIARGRAVAAAADLVLACGDAGTGDPMGLVEGAAGEVWRVGLRVDLGRAGWLGKGDFAVSAVSGEGVEALVRAVRGWFVPGLDDADGR